MKMCQERSRNWKNKVGAWINVLKAGCKKNPKMKKKGGAFCSARNYNYGQLQVGGHT